MEKTIYTVGHSNHTIDEFKNLIVEFNITCIVDVRSVPASAHTPQFNKDNLKNYLKGNHISYLHFGKEFGARRYDALDNYGNVNFEEVTKTKDFLHGISRLIDGLNKGFKIALMCSEARPIECHRFALISRYLSEKDFNIKHILPEKILVDNIEIEKSMIKEYLKKKKLRETGGLFDTYTEIEQRSDAYKLKNKEIAFHAEPIEEIL